MNRAWQTFLVLVAVFGPAVAQDKPTGKVTLPSEDWQDLGPYDPATHGPPGVPVVSVPDGPRFGADAESGRLVVAHGDAFTEPKPVSLPVKGVECVALAADGKTLFVGSRSDWAVWAFPIGRDGMPTKGRRHADLALPRGTDRLPVTALTTDTAGRLYAATRVGIQVFDRTGRLVEVISLPAKGEVFGLAWTGDKRDRLTAHGDWPGGATFARRVRATGAD